ncbi:hypothetical protein Sbs19_43930 [Sphingobium sp. BS19]|nr:hypothetical protein Sbs19_43930 [Sphingobium sp. BS19]
MVGGLPGNLTLNVVEISDALECLVRDWRFLRYPDVMEIPSPMGKAGGFPEAWVSGGIGFI